MQLGKSEITIEEQEEWQKIIMPAEQHKGLFIFYSLTMIIWVAAFIYILAGLFLPFEIVRPLQSVLVWRGILLTWLIVWIWFARRSIWKYWQYYAAKREILFVNEQEFIIRRPVSIFGITTVYDMAHIQTIFMDDEEACPSFQYGVRPVLFGKGLPASDAKQLISLLNHRYFPSEIVDDDF